MNIHSLAIKDVYKSLVASEHGLTEIEALKRLHEYGLNEIKEIRGKPLYEKFIEQFTHFLAILLWTASGLCFLSEYLHPGEGLKNLGMAIVGVILINALFTFVQEYRAEKAVKELKKLLPSNVKVLREGTVKDIRSQFVVPGDLMVLNEGDKVPADARVTESRCLMVNNAPLTGESDSKPRKSDAFEGDYLESPNIIFSGTHVVSGNGRAIVFSTGMSTEFGKIAHLTGGVQERISPLQAEIVRVTKIVAVIALTTGIFFFLMGFLTGRGFWNNLLFAIGIIIANVPEGLLPTVTLSLAMGSQRMARNKALIKTLTSVETLGSITVICTDKTGTLTQNKMVVQKIWAAGGQSIEYGTQSLENRQPSDDRVDIDGRKKSMSYSKLIKIAYLCSNARYEYGMYKGDPTEIAIFKKAREGIGAVEAERVFEMPFDSERKRMTTVNRIKGKTFVCMKGAPETVIPLCTKILRDDEVQMICDADIKFLSEVYRSMMDDGQRVIAFAYKEIISVSGIENLESGIKEQNSELQMLKPKLELESDMIFAGFMGLEDPPRTEVPEAIKKCGEAGIKVIMITGDAGGTAVAIAKQIGLVQKEPSVIEGHELNFMTDDELRQKLSSSQIIFARMTPTHKMRIVSVLEDEGERVAVTGDGVNDAPALKKANIGIAMGMTGTDVAREASDIVLLDDNFASIVNAVEEGRSIFENIRKFISYIFASNIPEIIPYIAYVLFSIPLPLTIMQILAVDLGTDIFPALALGAEKPSPGVMKQPPRSPDEKLFNFRILSRAYLFLGPIEAAAGLFGFFYVLYSGGWQWGAVISSGNVLYLQATTACLAGIIISQTGNVFACRSSRESVISLGFFSNRLIIAGIIIELILSAFIIYHPHGNKIFGTAPLNLNLLLVLFPFSIGLFLAEELRKFYVREINRKI
ncbi:MAG: cation-transporting P-type ATPase [Nitrospiraceae bacterium]|nr:MAG: cation-transporting P-type ATPase [Nitrospiraceae bacterium]